MRADVWAAVCVKVDVHVGEFDDQHTLDQIESEARHKAEKAVTAALQSAGLRMWPGTPEGPAKVERINIQVLP